MKMTVVCVVLFLTGCAPAEEETASQFTQRLKEVIVAGDTAAFSQLPCFPSDCIGQDELNYVFGSNGEESYLAELLKKPQTKVRVFGPYEYTNTAEGNEYVIIYYDPSLVVFDEAGHLARSERENLWWAGYVETAAIFHKGEWAFNRTPFYYGAHLPWAVDY